MPSGHKEPEPIEPSAREIVLVMFGTLANTTWRLFVPTIGGTILGVWADNSWDTKPWFTIIGVSLGTIGSFMLIYAQLSQIKKSGLKKKKD